MNGMDDNVPDVCKICHYIISPEEDAAEEICEKCRENQHIQAIVDASVKMYCFNKESRKVLSTAVSPTHKTILIRERTDTEKENYQAWESAVAAYVKEWGGDE